MHNDMRTMILKNLMLTGALSALSLPMQAQLLRGTVKDNGLENVVVAYSPTGSALSTDYKEVPVTNGTFTYDLTPDAPFADVTLQAGEAVFGAHLVPGKTVEVTITKAPDGTLTCSYAGDNADINRFYNRFTRAFDMMRYFAIDPAEAKTYEEYATLLRNETDSVRALLPTIADASLRDYYTRLTDGTNRWQQIRLLMDRAYEDSTDLDADPLYRSLIDSIDVNDNMALRCNLSLAWLNSKVKAPMADDMAPYCRAFMAAVDKYVTNPAVRREMVRNTVYSYFTYGKGEGDIEQFWTDLKQFAGTDNADLLTPYEAKMEAYRKTGKGAPAFDTTMTSPEGKVDRLSDHFGKFLYIDVWATWCGPCCAEIPHLEKLVERFKDNDRVEFISLSVDSDRKAWQKKLDTDRPAWAQFILSKDETAAFMKAWGITGIPRFIMIDKEGRIFAADATRPSDEATAATIEEQTRL